MIWWREETREPYEVIMAYLKRKYMSYEEIMDAKEEVEKIEWPLLDDSDLIDFVRKLPLNQRAVVSKGSFYRSYGSYGGIEFMMPSTRELLDYDIMDLIDTESRKGVVEFRITDSHNEANQLGFIESETTRTIRCGLFK